MNSDALLITLRSFAPQPWPVAEGLQLYLLIGSQGSPPLLAADRRNPCAETEAAQDAVARDAEMAVALSKLSESGQTLLELYVARNPGPAWDCFQPAAPRARQNTAMVLDASQRDPAP